MRSESIRPTGEEARALARAVLQEARFGSLGVIEPDTGAPAVTRIAVATDWEGFPITLISALSQHTKALERNPECSLLVGEPGPKGDPLAHPRLTLQCRASFIEKDSGQRCQLRKRYLELIPKAALYIDFADFRLVRLNIHRAFLNGGFGKAYLLDAEDVVRNSTA